MDRWEYLVAEFVVIPGPDDVFWKHLDPTWEFCALYPSGKAMLFKRKLSQGD
jgi:hypothetical protein